MKSNLLIFSYMVITFCVIYKTSFATVNNGLSPGRSVFFLSVTFKKIAQKSFVWCEVEFKCVCFPGLCYSCCFSYVVVFTHSTDPKPFFCSLPLPFGFFGYLFTTLFGRNKKISDLIRYENL